MERAGGRYLCPLGMLSSNLMNRAVVSTEAAQLLFPCVNPTGTLSRCCNLI